ncbi:tRNA threonylcarbamoyladenosine dehydratase [uncultured Clostridium sp.]|jgi:tRNA A37 threonylcarbamoyladenosine dehydratase|uniref:tRNA threonylcarbamoyladenosine dehydratase n=1 Tax=uncultured Clostridium sp. TaxID=59620 RepID=UPI00263971D9|nr:tRNA threonylcarbamoyladenosine dehydratase [uncultured Clostridium sp.]
MLNEQLVRTQLLIGEEGIEKLQNSKVIVFGVGGVGSFTTEALTRTGIGTIIIVDNDTVDISNLNRQIHATRETVDKIKVEVMRDRMLLINPECNVITKQVFLTADNMEEVIPDDIDYVVDAIDSVTSKLALAEYCYNKDIKIIASMGTGNKLDPSLFKVADIHKTSVCPLARVMRNELKKRRVKKLKVVYSEELPIKPQSPQVDAQKKVDGEDITRLSKRQSPGSMSFVPGVAGMILASQVVKDLLEK